MKEGRDEKAYGILKERMDMAFNVLTKDVKGVVPFGKEPKPLDEQIYDYNNMPPEQLEQMIAESGEFEVEKWLKKMSGITGGQNG